MKGAMAAPIPDDDKIRIEVDGPGVSPQNVEPLSVLNLGRAFFVLLHKLAEERDVPLKFFGLTVEDKCMALAVRTSDPSAAALLTAEAPRLLALEDIPTKNIQASLNALRDAIGQLPSGYRVKAMVRRQDFDLQPKRTSAWVPPRATAQLRCRLAFLGGINKYSAQFTSVSEDRTFTLDVTEEDALHLRPYLFELVDVDAVIQRNAQGLIARGILKGFRPVASGNAAKEWRKWFRPIDDEWAKVADLDAELGRV